MGSSSLSSFRLCSDLLSDLQGRPLPPLRLDKTPPAGNKVGLWSRDADPRGQANDVSARFGRRLRLLRLERQMTQLDMAKRFGIDRSYISEVERGRKSMTLAMLEVIALGMEISLSRLFENM